MKSLNALLLVLLLTGFMLMSCTTPSPKAFVSAGETSAGETSAGETSAGETNAGETSAGETSAGETSAGETSAGETSVGETSVNDRLEDLNADPQSRGPAQVGYMTDMFNYDSGLGEEHRELRLALWYPAQAGTGSGDARYPLFVPDDAEQDALPYDMSQMPVLIYSHGAKVWPEMGSFMAEYFASHGWIVAAISHTGDGLANVSDDRPDEIYAWRPLDLSATLDYLERLPESHPLYEKANTGRALVSGHSFGGYTTLLSAGALVDLNFLRQTHCEERGGTLCDSLNGPLGERIASGFVDPRFVAAIPQSAGNFDFIRQGASQVNIPILMITATRDQACTEEESNRPYWEALTAPDSLLKDQHRRLSFLNAGHATFTVACQHLPTLEQNDGCGPDFTPIREAQAVMLAFSLMFGRAYVLSDEVALRSITQGEGLPTLPDWVQWLQAN